MPARFRIGFFPELDIRLKNPQLRKMPAVSCTPELLDNYPTLGLQTNTPAHPPGDCKQHKVEFFGSPRKIEREPGIREFPVEPGELVPDGRINGREDKFPCIRDKLL